MCVRALYKNHVTVFWFIREFIFQRNHTDIDTSESFQALPTKMVVLVDVLPFVKKGCTSSVPRLYRLKNGSGTPDRIGKTLDTQ